MVTCEFIRENMDLYLRGALDADVAAQVEAHMAQCPECRKLVEEYKMLLQGLKNLPVASPPGDLEEKLRVALRREATRQRNRRMAYLRWGAAGVVVAAALAIAFIIPSPLNVRNLSNINNESPSARSANDLAAATGNNQSTIMGLKQSSLPEEEMAPMMQTASSVADTSVPEDKWARSANVTLRQTDLSAIQKQAEQWGALAVEQDAGGQTYVLALDVPTEGYDAFMEYLKGLDVVQAIESLEENISEVYGQQQREFQQYQQEMQDLEKRSGTGKEEELREAQDKATESAKTLDDFLRRVMYVRFYFVIE